MQPDQVRPTRNSLQTVIAYATRWLRTFPVYPALLPFAIYTHWYVNLRFQMEFGEYLFPILALVGGFLLLMLALTWPAGNIRRAGFATFLFSFVVNFLPHDTLDVVPESIALYVVSAATIATLVALLYFLRQSRSDLFNFTFFMNIVVAAICLPDIYHIVTWEIEVAPHRPPVEQIFPDLPESGAHAGPDVWHLVFDRYAGSETMAKVYGFDNSEFLAALEQRGFSIGTDARANYHQTAFSLLSTLNLDYLDGMGERGNLMRADWVPIYRGLRDNRVVRFFDHLGYKIYHAGSWWESTRYTRRAVENVNYLSMPEFARSMLQHSLVGPTLAALGLGIGDGRQDQCSRITYQFNRLRQVAVVADQKFVFGHLLVPHPPFVFRPDGSCKGVAETAASTRAQNYVDQVKFANREILKLVDSILAGPRPAMIILQADEGPWPARFIDNEIFGTKDHVNEQRLELSPAETREKMLIFLAVRAPGPVPFVLEPQATPVNLYRRILDDQFGLHLPILPDRSYLVRSPADLYTFEDITAALH